MPMTGRKVKTRGWEDSGHGRHCVGIPADPERSPRRVQAHERSGPQRHPGKDGSRSSWVTPTKAYHRTDPSGQAYVATSCPTSSSRSSRTQSDCLTTTRLRSTSTGRSLLARHVQSRRTSIYSPSTCRVRQRSVVAFPSPTRTGVEALRSPTRLPRTTTATQTRRTETGSSSATTASTSPGQIPPPSSRCSLQTHVRLAASTATSTGTLRDGDRSSQRGSRRRQNSLCAPHARHFWPLPGWSASMTTPGRPTERGPVSVGVRSSPDSPFTSHFCSRGRPGSKRPRAEN